MRVQQAQERLEAAAQRSATQEEVAAINKELAFRRAHSESIKLIQSLIAKSGDMEFTVNPEAANQLKQELEAARSAQKALNAQAVAAGVDLGYVEPSSQPQASLAFNNPEEAEAANLPKGTLITVAGRPARVD
jgi:argininosuccinate lyase